MKGEAIGILTSLMSAAMIVGSVVSGALFELYDSLPYYLATALMVISLTIALSIQRHPPPEPNRPSA
jgi:hypothetical protein